jgi:hypothetical protein
MIKLIIGLMIMNICLVITFVIIMERYLKKIEDRKENG